jgi:hypothetical protein
MREFPDPRLLCSARPYKAAGSLYLLGTSVQMVRAVEFATVKCNLLRGWRVVQTWMLWFGEFVPEPCLRQKADAAPAAAYCVTTSLVSRGDNSVQSSFGVQWSIGYKSVAKPRFSAPYSIVATLARCCARNDYAQRHSLCNVGICHLVLPTTRSSGGSS